MRLLRSSKRALTSAVAALHLALAPAGAETPFLAVRDWPVEKFFEEVGMLTRWTMLEGIVRTAGVDEVHFHACLDAASGDRILRQGRIADVVDICLDYARSKG